MQSSALQTIPITVAENLPPSALPAKRNKAVSTYNWTPVKEEALRSMVALGSTAPSMRDIAVELFGTERARSAVAGKMFRLGLKKISQEQRAAKRAAPHKGPKVRASSYNNPVRFGPQPQTLPRVFKDTDPADLMPPIRAFMCTLAELGPSQCHAPIGDPSQSGFMFCGIPDTRLPGPYCDFHFAMFYQRGTTLSGSPAIRRRAKDSKRYMVGMGWSGLEKDGQCVAD